MTSSDSLFQKIAVIIESAQNQIVQSANLVLVYTYFEIGRLIVEEEQGGTARGIWEKGGSNAGEKLDRTVWKRVFV